MAEPSSLYLYTLQAVIIILINPARDSSLTKLSLNPQPSKSSLKQKQKQTPKPLADSWKDEDEEDSGEETDSPLSLQQSADCPSAPPPTNINGETFINPYGYSVDRGAAKKRDERTTRPEKTNAVAGRLITGALEVKAPKKTEGQRAYDRVIKEKEMERRNFEKEVAVKAKEDAERAKVAVWTD